jgi:hypothetical protein
MLDLFERAGFAVKALHMEQWPQIPIAATKLSAEFASMPKEDLLISGVDVVLTRR